MNIMMSIGGIKMGRKPIFEKPMTQVERNRRYLDKLKSRTKNNISATSVAESESKYSKKLFQKFFRKN